MSLDCGHSPTVARRLASNSGEIGRTGPTDLAGRARLALATDRVRKLDEVILAEPGVVDLKSFLFCFVVAQVEGCSCGPGIHGAFHPVAVQEAAIGNGIGGVCLIKRFAKLR